MTHDFRHTGRLCIDFALTGGEGPRFSRFERLHAPADRTAWFAESPLRAEGAAADEDDIADARRLRWAIWWAVQAALRDEPPAQRDARVIEELAARAPLVPALGGGWRGPTAAAGMSDVARDAIALLSDPAERARLRVCAAPDCVVPFYDDSRPGRRRWCEATRCGDRNRQRALRARRAGG
jgi:predicted RNA-binding Zn ribbon-like protein